jgi:CheY-like chemotaxis protein
LARKILLADDSVTAQNMGRKILADAGYEVIAVNNGSAALKKIAELKPDLVILDVYMPGYSGLEVCQRLKESQETARIPVLLSVGKLEPFKPEEAQRVRADSYIVKPFEASELLSALSKLEDKVVPRAEPSKPGRFARAMAAAEETSRGRKETASDQNGWSSRIGFPHEKTQPEEKVADDSAIYNPMNRDLRTVVETASEKAAEKREETQPAPVANVSETSVDVAALAPAGLPRDVTPEEVAAIAAAAAKMQMAGAAVADERQASEIRPSEAQASEATSGRSLEPPSDRVGQAFVAPAPQEATTDGPQENRVDAAGSEAIATPEAQLNGDVKAEEAQDLPVTMAAATAESAADNAPRWTAVPVALEGEEATVSLEEEMQKAYAAYASYVAAETASDVSAMQAVEAPAPDHASSADAAPVVEAAPVESSSFPEVAQVEADAVISAPPEFADPSPGFVPVAESVAAAAETPVAEPAVASHAVAEPASLVAPPAQEAPAEEAQPWSEPAPATAEVIAASGGDSAPIVEAHEAEAHEADAQEPAKESKPESEAVKSTAAAWASWRQIRDTRKDSEVAQPKSKEFEVPEPVPAETAARAVAAGAEQISQEVSAAPKSDVADVASIVESVLANLRPKLMEEISRKMAEKK